MNDIAQARHPHLRPDFLKTLPERGEGKLALFDADGTFWTDDVNDDLTKWCIDSGILLHSNLWEDYLRVYAKDPVKGCAYALKLFQGLPRKELQKSIEIWWREHSRRKWIKEVVEVFHVCKERGYTVWVVTGTPTDLMKPLMEILSVDQVLGMDFEVDDGGIITGEVSGIHCAGPGKAEKVQKLWKGGEIAFSCGNSLMDAPMMELVQKGPIWAVYPNPQFQAYAEKKGWPILSRPADFKEEEKFLKF